MGSPLTAGRGPATTKGKRDRDLGLGRGPELQAASAIDHPCLVKPP